ncbi:MAG: hypothetical protein COA69_03330 [Robiginitomaculum sp.]|nr:MAG: hypothetical protein COA69_03330 [Robiginitomaculum sp.]
MMKMKRIQKNVYITIGAILFSGLCSAGSALAAPISAPSIKLEQANKAIQACLSMARSHNIDISIAILDYNGDIVSFQRMDGANRLTIKFATQKAMTSIVIKKPSKTAQDRISQGHTQILAIEGILPIQGGLPIMVGKKLVGAIGVSGAPPVLDEKCAQIGLNALQIK